MGKQPRILELGPKLEAQGYRILDRRLFLPTVGGAKGKKKAKAAVSATMSEMLKSAEGFQAGIVALLAQGLIAPTEGAVATAASSGAENTASTAAEPMMVDPLAPAPDSSTASAQSPSASEERPPSPMAPMGLTEQPPTGEPPEEARHGAPALPPVYQYAPSSVPWQHPVDVPWLPVAPQFQWPSATPTYAPLGLSPYVGATLGGPWEWGPVPPSTFAQPVHTTDPAVLPSPPVPSSPDPSPSPLLAQHDTSDGTQLLSLDTQPSTFATGTASSRTDEAEEDADPDDVAQMEGILAAYFPDDAGEFELNEQEPGAEDVHATVGGGVGVGVGGESITVPDGVHSVAPGIVRYTLPRRPHPFHIEMVKVAAVAPTQAAQQSIFTAAKLYDDQVRKNEVQRKKSATAEKAQETRFVEVFGREIRTEEGAVEKFVGGLEAMADRLGWSVEDLMNTAGFRKWARKTAKSDFKGAQETIKDQQDMLWKLREVAQQHTMSDSGMAHIFTTMKMGGITGYAYSATGKAIDSASDDLFGTKTIGSMTYSSVRKIIKFELETLAEKLPPGSRVCFIVYGDARIHCRAANVSSTILCIRRLILDKDNKPSVIPTRLYTLAVFLGKDDLDNLKKHMGPVLDDLKDLTDDKPVETSVGNYLIELYAGGDAKWLNATFGCGSCSHGPCFLCLSPQAEFRNYATSYTHPGPVPSGLLDFIPRERIIICTLHLFQRLSERVFSLVCRQLLVIAGKENVDEAEQSAFLTKELFSVVNVTDDARANQRFAVKWCPVDKEYVVSPEHNGVRQLAMMNRLRVENIPFLAAINIAQEPTATVQAAAHAQPFPPGPKKRGRSSAADRAAQQAQQAELEARRAAAAAAAAEAVPAAARQPPVITPLQLNKNRITYMMNIVVAFRTICEIVRSPYPFLRGYTLGTFTSGLDMPTDICPDPTVPLNGASFTALVRNFLHYATTDRPELGVASFTSPSRLSTLYTHLLLAHAGPLIETHGDIHTNSTEASESLNKSDSSRVARTTNMAKDVTLQIVRQSHRKHVNLTDAHANDHPCPFIHVCSKRYARLCTLVTHVAEHHPGESFDKEVYMEITRPALLDAEAKSRSAVDGLVDKPARLKKVNITQRERAKKYRDRRRMREQMVREVHAIDQAQPQQAQAQAQAQT